MSIFTNPIKVIENWWSGSTLSTAFKNIFHAVAEEVESVGTAQILSVISADASAAMVGASGGIAGMVAAGVAAAAPLLEKAGLTISEGTLTTLIAAMATNQAAATASTKAST